MRARGIRRPLEVETRTLDEVREVLAILDAAGGGGGGAASCSSGSGSGSMITRIMLDNMTKRSVGVPGGWGGMVACTSVRVCVCVCVERGQAGE